MELCCLLKELDTNLAALTAKFEQATAEKLQCQQEADATNRVITLANRYHASTACPLLPALPGDSGTGVTEA